jgi:5'-nucleotidase
MRILVTNDDGIRSPYLAMLAEAAKALGEVTVIAPMEQCSAMSHRITLYRPMEFQLQEDFPVEGVQAYRIDGTPADCVRISYHGLFEKGKEPELVLSGINDGANCGYDIQYSATVGAAMEAVLYHVPAICFSQRRGGCDQILREHLSSILMELAQNMPGRGEAWNVNFPNCFPEQFRGILYDRRPAQTPFFDDVYYRQVRGDGGHDILLKAKEITGAEEGSDIQALIDGYISVGVIRNQVME